MPAQIPFTSVLHHLLATTVCTCKQKSDWCENQEGEVMDQSEKSLCSELKIEHLKANCCLETQIAGNYEARLQWGENR